MLCKFCEFFCWKKCSSWWFCVDVCVFSCSLGPDTVFSETCWCWKHHYRSNISMRSFTTKKNISELYFHVASLNRRFPVLYQQDDCFQKIECPYFSIKPLAQEPLMPYSGEQTSWMLQSSMPKSRVAPGCMQRAGAFKQHHIAGLFLKPQLKSSFRRKFCKLLHLNRKVVTKPHRPLIRPRSG